MKRIITQKLIDWKNNIDRKPLIVRGARQVGKSYTITEFGKMNYTGNIHIINLEKQPDWHYIFEKNFDAKRIISELELVINKRIIPKDDLLFFDEIQACPKAIIALRYFYEQVPELHIIAAGSLLEFAINDITFPVGRVQILNMNPMNFNEFLISRNKEIIANKLIDEPIELSETVHSSVIDELRKYFFVGGMPECVKIFNQRNSFQEIFDFQLNLIETFRNDFSKYSKYVDKNCLLTVLNSVASKVGHQIKYSHLAESYSIPTIKKAINLLETAKLFKKIKATSPAGFPIKSNINEKIFKLIMLDIGLLSRLNGLMNTLEFQKSELLSTFKGMMAEQFIGQELVSNGYNELFYWSREKKSSSAEIDFLIEIGNEIVPIEVKSGAIGKFKSLHILLENYQNLKKAYIFSDNKKIYNHDRKYYFFPLYYSYTLTNKN